jgi:hypothetical protein
MYALKKSALRAAAACAALACVETARAAEGFELRYNVAGSLGGEMFVPPDQKGWIGGVAVTHIKINKVTGDDGKRMAIGIPGGAVPMPAPIPAALNPTYGRNAAQLDASGTMTRMDLALGYLTSDRYGGGRLAFGIDIPFARKSQSVNASAGTPALNWNAALPAAARAAAQAQFGTQYQAAVSAQTADMNGDVSGIGDMELLAGWEYVGEKLRVLAGGSIVLPTGKYDKGAAPDIGTGNFFTFRPALQAAYLPTPDIGLAGKVTIGLNTRNRDNDLRSGNWVGLEAAAGYKTRIGVFGLHGVHVQQYQDDDNNPLGPSRLRSTHAGAFFTTKVPGIDAALTVQYMATTSSHNAKHGDFMQLRLIKTF